MTEQTGNARAKNVPNAAKVLRPEVSVSVPAPLQGKPQ